MRNFHTSRLGRIALAASGAMLLLGSHAFAQSVQVFDDAPSIEQLRSIMIPESHPGLSRSIVIQRPDTSAAQPASAVQTVASSQAVAAPQQPVATHVAAPVPARVAQADDAMPAPRSKAPAQQPSEPGAVAFHINFTFDSAQLPNSAHDMMDRIAELMKEAPQVKLRIEGHTDAAGSAGYNMTLSQRRALSVGEYLVSQGVDPSRLILVGKGMTEPLTRNPYDPTNRRVQFVRVG
jgi:outer membrane protein OmpA-like peptidoglycan-associated protein